MANREVIRGDSYALRRPFFKLTLVNDLGQPFDLTGCTVRTTYKPAIVSATTDPNDSTAAIKHTIVIDGTGTATTSDGLFLDGAASGGKLIERLTAAETLALPMDVQLVSDVELTDANGEVFTWPIEDTVSAKDAVTNRTT